MAIGRQTRIITLLVIDSFFFILEISIGYAVNSLALIADSFHMLNDVFSLIVALWAVRLAKSRSATAEYTYGWQRAEILGALINGVFLLALCLSIFLEAIQRFVEPQVITNPKLILVVGCAGLVSNIVGLFLFHDHGHGHGHSHGHGHDHGHSHSPITNSSNHSHSHTEEASSGHLKHSDLEAGAHNHHHEEEEETNEHVHGFFKHNNDYNNENDQSIDAVWPRNVVAGSISAQPFSDDDNSYSNNYGTVKTNNNNNLLPNDEGSSSNENDNLLSTNKSKKSTLNSTDGIQHRSRSLSTHKYHFHTIKKQQAAELGQEKNKKQRSLNMEGVFLHVLGDALGNIGVIATALFIWLSDYSWRFYFDPIVSLVITCIIFSSALPLVKAASKILLQATPAGVSLDEVADDIMSFDGVKSVHDLHVWILRENLFIASLHVAVTIPPENFMELARRIRHCLHEYGIHSATIQPEFLSLAGVSNKSNQTASSSNDESNSNNANTASSTFNNSINKNDIDKNTNGNNTSTNSTNNNSKTTQLIEAPIKGPDGCSCLIECCAPKKFT